MSSKWSKEETLKFVECVQQYPCLYTVKSSEYLDRGLKAQAFNEILAQMQECMPNITLEDVKTKLRNLRTQYLREKRMVDASKKSGSGINDVYIPKLWCYEHLQFLKNHADMRTSVDNIEASNEPSTSRVISQKKYVVNNDGATKTLSDSESTTEDSNIYENPRRKRAKADGPVKTLLNKMDKIQSRLITQHNPQRYDWLGKLVVTEMENIDPEDRPDAAWKIQCVMREFTDKARKKQKISESSTSSTKDLIEQSMDGIFDVSDFIEEIEELP